MMRHLNNKGYMLVEIILAFVLAMVVMYFVTELTIKLKNKNDDLLVKTLVATDQAIIYNTIMRDLYNTDSDINCDYLVDNGLSISRNVFEYKEFKNIVSKYALLKNYECTYKDGVVSLKIPIEVEQLQNENFSVNIKFTNKNKKD